MSLSDSLSGVALELRRHDLPGRLVAVCGADGTGKSTTVSLLATALRNEVADASSVVHVRQPSNWMRSDPHYNSTIVKEGGAELADEFSLGVFGVADRLNQQARIIEPALAAGNTVVADRYAFCLLAYYLAMREPKLHYLASICELLFQPDITFVLDCPPQVAVERVIERDGPRAEKYEQQIGPATEMMEAYRAIARRNKLHLVSSVDPPEVVVTKLREILYEHDIGAGV